MLKQAAAGTTPGATGLASAAHEMSLLVGQTLRPRGDSAQISLDGVARLGHVAFTEARFLERVQRTDGSFIACPDSSLFLSLAAAAGAFNSA
jgi:hypothetical protein